MKTEKLRTFPGDLALRQQLAQNALLHSDQISHSVMSDSLRPHESQHARPPCPSPTPGVHHSPRQMEKVLISTPL